MVRRETEEVEETRLDCFCPIVLLNLGPRSALYKQSQWIVLSGVGSTLTVDNVNSQLRTLVILDGEGMSSAFWSFAFTDDV